MLPLLLAAKVDVACKHISKLLLVATVTSSSINRTSEHGTFPQISSRFEEISALSGAPARASCTRTVLQAGRRLPGSHGLHRHCSSEYCP